MRMLLLAVALLGGWAVAEMVPPYRDVTRPFGERAVDLVARMTPEEKAGQLLCGRNPRAHGIERLGIRPYEWWSEALHGVARDGTATSFPTGLGLAATWDPALIERMGRVTSDEARDKFNGRKSAHGLAYWSPTINLSRDPRWGRAEEAYGEDPYLTARIAQAFVEGMQGAHEPGGAEYLKTFATPKHFLANNSEQNRHSGSSNLTERELREYYTWAFKWAIEKGKAHSLMTSYNAVNGTPTTVDRDLLEGIVRRTWGFKGYITTDCDTIDDVARRHAWRPKGWQGAWTRRAAVAYAMKAGVEANCGRSFATCALAAIKDGLLTEADLDRSLVRLFTARMRSGEFDPDGGPFGGIKDCIHNEAAQALAQKVADEAVVLLQNEGDFLPLTRAFAGKAAPTLVLVGHRADKLTLGDYSTHEPKHTSTALEGIKAAFLRHYPQGSFTYVRGQSLGEATAHLMNIRPPALLRADGSVARQLARQESAFSAEEEATLRAADAVVVFADTAPGEVGFYENHDGDTLDLPRGQSAMIQRVAALNPRTAVYLQTVSQANVEPFRGDVKAILWSTYNGQAQGNAAGRLLMGEVSPSARLPFTWYTDVNQLADIKDYALTSGKGRTYMHFTGDVTYPFGHGLTYSRFAYKNLTVSAETATPDDTLTVAFDLTNEGKASAEEVAQLYVVSPGADGVRRPRKRLRAFQKVALKPGETRRVELHLPVDELWFWDEAAKKQRYDLGAYTLQVGANAQAAERLTATFTLNGTLTRKPHALIALPSDHFLRVGVPGQRITVAASVSYNDQSLRFNAPIRYVSSNPAVAAVDAQTGEVTPKAPGLVTITASCSEADVTVTDSFPVCVR